MMSAGKLMVGNLAQKLKMLQIDLQPFMNLFGEG
jgi:hypothetical protein